MTWRDVTSKSPSKRRVRQDATLPCGKMPQWPLAWSLPTAGKMLNGACAGVGMMHAHALVMTTTLQDRLIAAAEAYEAAAIAARGERWGWGKLAPGVRHDWLLEQAGELRARARCLSTQAVDELLTDSY